MPLSAMVGLPHKPCSASVHFRPKAKFISPRTSRVELLAWVWSLVRLRRTVGCRVRLGKYEADRIERDVSGSLCLVEVRSRQTCEMALASVGRVKQRRLAAMGRRLAKVTREPVTIVVEGIGGGKIVRQVLGVVQPDWAAHN